MPEVRSRRYDHGVPLAFWTCAAITAISAAVSFGYAAVGLRQSPDGAARTASQYAFARSAALLVAAVTAPFAGSTGFLAAVAIAMVIVQGADSLIGISIRDRVKTIGPAATAAANLGAVLWLLVT